MHSWLLCCILITHPGSVCTFTSLPPGIFSLVVNLDIPLLSAVLCPPQHPWGQYAVIHLMLLLMLAAGYRKRS